VGGPRTAARASRENLGLAAKRLLDLIIAATLLALLSPLLATLALAIKLDSPGPVLYRCRRVGRGGADLFMLKFRKMRDDAAGLPLTLSGDARLTRLGRFLAGSKLDEIPQLWNVLKGEMSLVGPRPEDPQLVALAGGGYAEILRVKPGMTGLTQLAFAHESSILDRENTVADYVERLLPQKMALDRLYASSWSLLLDLRILRWTVAAVMLGKDVAVHRVTGHMSVRRRTVELEVTGPALATAAVES
jgi:lipopolysaccharide/colanic/teichoic acid biosynthesis glycosyltransferase